MTSQSKKLDVSIIIPTYNEAPRIVHTLKQTLDYMKVLPHNFEIIVSDADSPDGTADLVNNVAKDHKQVRLVEAGSRQGKGRNVQAGLEAAKGRYHIFMDADLATPLHHLPPLLEYLEAGSDVVIAERELNRIHKGIRLLFSVFGNWLVRFVALPGIMDSQCGFKGFTKETSSLLTEKQTIMGWGFDIEYLTIARRHKLRLSRISAEDWYDPKINDEGLVSDSPLSAAIKTFVELGKIKLNDLKGVYK